MTLLVRNARVGSQTQDILCTDGMVAAIGPSIRDTDAEVLEAEGRLVCSGLVNAHAHIDKAFLIGEDDYVDVSGPEKGALVLAKKRHQSVDQIRERAERVVRGAIRAGCSILRTNVDVDGAVGLRGVEAALALRETYRGQIHLQVVAFAQEGFDRFPETTGLLEEAVGMGCDAIGGHTLVDSDGEAHIDTVLGLAQRLDVECEFHVDESGRAEHFLLPYLAERTIQSGYKGRVNAIHACSLSAVDDSAAARAIELVASADLGVIVAPTAIATRQLTRYGDLCAAGVRLGVGTDNIGDYFNPVGSASVLLPATLLVYSKRLFTTDQLRSLSEQLTNEGAKVCGIGDYGIRPGGPADFTVLQATTPRELFREPGLAPVVVRSGRVLVSDG